jgi:hypothetical protein
LNVYNLNRQNVHSSVLEGSVLAAVIQEFCNENVVGDHYKHEFLLKDFLAAITISLAMEVSKRMYRNR